MSILTTHVGSLPRPKNVTDLLFKRENNEVYEQKYFDEVISNGVYEVVKKQIDAAAPHNKIPIFEIMPTPIGYPQV